MKKTAKSRGLLVVLFVLFLTTNYVYSQIPLVVKGKVTDEFSGKPVSCTIEFRTHDGKKIKVNSMTDGSYQQVLSSGQTVDVYLYNWDVLREKVSYTVPDKEEYQEIEKNFTAKKLEKGNLIYKEDFFGKSSSSLNSGTDQFLKDLNTIMRFNRSVSFDLYVNAHDTYSRSSGKIKSLVNKRISTLEDKFKDYPMFKDRINLIADDSKPNGKANSSNPDTFIKVHEIKDIFK